MRNISRPRTTESRKRNRFRSRGNRTFRVFEFITTTFNSLGLKPQCPVDHFIVQEIPDILNGFNPVGLDIPSVGFIHEKKPSHDPR
jgi:hypothetical protein